MISTFLLGSIPFVLVAFAWMCSRRASYAQGKADAFREVANDFQGLASCTWWPKRMEAERAAERKKRMLNLCLCDERVCDALAAALVEAREHWRYPRVDRKAAPTAENVEDAQTTGERG